MLIRLKQLKIETKFIAEVENKIKHLKYRTTRNKLRIFVLLWQLLIGKYAKYSNNGYKAFVKDLFTSR